MKIDDWLNTFTHIFRHLFLPIVNVLKHSLRSLSWFKYTPKISRLSHSDIYTLYTGAALWNATSAYFRFGFWDWSCKSKIKKALPEKFLRLAVCNHVFWRQRRTSCCLWGRSNCRHWRRKLYFQSHYFRVVTWFKRAKMYKWYDCECLCRHSTIPPMDKEKHWRR